MQKNIPMNYNTYSRQVEEAIQTDDEIASEQFRQRIASGQVAIICALVRHDVDIKSFFWSEIRGRVDQSQEVAPFFIKNDDGHLIRGIAVWPKEHTTARVSSDNGLE